MKITDRHKKVEQAIAAGHHSEEGIIKLSMLTKATVKKALKEMIAAGMLSQNGSFYYMTTENAKAFTGENPVTSPSGETSPTVSPTGEQVKAEPKKVKIKFKHSQNVELLKKVFAFFGYGIETANITLFTVIPPQQQAHEESILEDVDAILYFFGSNYTLEAINCKDGQFLPVKHISQLDPKTQIMLGQTFESHAKKYRVCHVISKALVPYDDISKAPEVQIEFKALDKDGAEYLFNISTIKKNPLQIHKLKGTSSKRPRFSKIEKMF
jgi:hypothetical protein